MPALQLVTLLLHLIFPTLYYHRALLLQLLQVVHHRHTRWQQHLLF